MSAALNEAGQIVEALHALGLQLHGFGMKGGAVARYGGLLASADSMAWSAAGRRRPDPACRKATCANCLHYALDWRERVLGAYQPEAAVQLGLALRAA